MNKKPILFLFIFLISTVILHATSEYVVVVSPEVKADAAWMDVALKLQKNHKATLIFHDGQLSSILTQLRQEKPRYVAFVEKPEALGKEYVMNLNRLSRRVDDDIFADFLWGIITGYNATAAMRMVDNSQKPLVIKDCVATIAELKEAKWFDRFGYLDDHVSGQWGEKISPQSPMVFGRNFPEGQRDKDAEMKRFGELYAKYNPDLIVTAAHATERNLEMPFSLGNVKPSGGRLYLDLKDGPQFLTNTGKRKVYLPIGNCLIGNVNKTRESMAIAWMNDGNAATFVGYVVPTWHGRNGWGGLKYFLTTPGKYTVAQAFYINQQDMLQQLFDWNAALLTQNYPFDKADEVGDKLVESILGKDYTKDQLGFFYDRDVLAYYGDPLWDARLQPIKEETDYTVTCKQKGKKVFLTIRTKPNFNLHRMEGDDFKKEHVLDLPFSYFFPKRLNHPTLSPGQQFKVALDENFLLIYNPQFQPDKTYTIEIDVQ